jgi:hypothetical protein
MIFIKGYVCLVFFKFSGYNIRPSPLLLDFRPASIFIGVLSKYSLSLGFMGIVVMIVLFPWFVCAFIRFASLFWPCFYFRIIGQFFLVANFPGTGGLTFIYPEIMRNAQNGG